MSTEARAGVPRWVWWTAGGLAVSSLVGAIVYTARSPGYERLLARTGAPEELQILAALQRYTESRGNPKAGLGQPELYPWWAEPRNAPRDKQVAESKNAADGYDRNAEAYGESPYPRRMWIFGTGGPYGLLPSSALAPWRDTDELRRGKVTPYDVFNPWRATVFFVDYVRRVIDRVIGESGTAALQVGLWNLVDALGMREDDLSTRVPVAWPDYLGARELVP